jgi:hypothetical protein
MRGTPLGCNWQFVRHIFPHISPHDTLKTLTRRLKMVTNKLKDQLILASIDHWPMDRPIDLTVVRKTHCWRFAMAAYALLHISGLGAKEGHHGQLSYPRRNTP